MNAERVKLGPVGIMQGRLSPPRGERIQSFPKETWKEEFVRAQKLGLDSIEWVLDEDLENPILDPIGVAKIHKMIRETGVKVLTVCADYFMAFPLVRATHSEVEGRLAILEKLIRSAGGLGVQYIVLPFVDASSIRTTLDESEVIESVTRVLPAAQRAGVQLVFETDLSPERFSVFLKEFPEDRVGVNYDIGNSASLGYSPKEEFRAYGHRIRTIHIKDRVRGGTTVPLGSGDAEFERVFDELKRFEFKGPLIFQGARQEPGREEETQKRYQEFLLRYLSSSTMPKVEVDQ